MVGLTDGEKILRICITVYTQYRRVMTDRQTSCHGIVHAMHTRRAVKKVQEILILYTNENLHTPYDTKGRVVSLPQLSFLLK